MKLIPPNLIFVAQVLDVLADPAVHPRQGRLSLLFREDPLLDIVEDAAGGQPCLREVGLLMAGELVASAILLAELSGD